MYLITTTTVDWELFVTYHFKIPLKIHEFHQIFKIR